MASHLSIYIGPYARCRFEIKTTTGEKTIKRLTCVNDACVNFRKKVTGKKFCSECGHSLDYITETQKYTNKAPSVTDEDCEDALSDAGFREDTFWEILRWRGESLNEHWLTPNKKKNQPRPFSFSEDEAEDVLITNIDKDAEIAWFAENFKGEIEVLRSIYAEVTLEWMFVTYWC